ncbi:hypothetical protein [Luteococcus sp. OSA5]|uniref:hypothetical protein n=1 Tax=Luteococcus sp. OSA5 TaxID=3401630 RepID=UPI003B432BC5
MSKANNERAHSTKLLEERLDKLQQRARRRRKSSITFQLTKKDIKLATKVACNVDLVD